MSIECNTDKKSVAETRSTNLLLKGQKTNEPLGVGSWESSPEGAGSGQPAYLGTNTMYQKEQLVFGQLGQSSNAP